MELDVIPVAALYLKRKVAVWITSCLRILIFFARTKSIIFSNVRSRTVAFSCKSLDTLCPCLLNENEASFPYAYTDSSNHSLLLARLDGVCTRRETWAYEQAEQSWYCLSRLS